MRILSLLLLLICAETSHAKTEEFLLDNGLKLLVKEDHRAPVAVSIIWYKAGSADEQSGEFGVAHVLEHLMFKGTSSYPLGVFSKTIAGLGGQENAFTSNDYTAYYEKVAAKQLETCFKLESDRMQNLLLLPEEFEKEIKVIREERRLRTEDSPEGLAFERFLATAHLAPAYQHPVIGWMSDLFQMRNEDAKSWYQRYYKPNQATLVVVGDVQPNEVYALAKQYFGSIPKGPIINQKTQLEPPALGQKKVEIKSANVKVPLIMLGYTVPSVKTTAAAPSLDPYVLELIAGILDAGDSGRFTKQLSVKQELASSASVYYNLYSRYQTQFILFGSPSQQHSLADLKAGFLAELDDLKNHLVQPEELQRVKKQIIAQKTFERDSIFEQAMELGLLETIGLGWKTSEQYIERINTITPEQIQAAAKRYFAEEKLTVAELLPKA